MKRYLVLALSLLIALSCTRKEKFEIHRGVNIAHWLSQSPVRGDERAAFFTEEDVARIAGWGFDHVRIPIDEVHMFHGDGTKDEEAFGLLRQALDLCGKYNLRAIVDLHILRSHNFNADYKPLFRERRAQEAFYRCWRRISEELNGYDVDMVAYELMNEPVANDPEDWNRVAGECYSAIRELEKERIIIIGSNRWQSIDTASQLALPERDPNVILSFHYYKPKLLTHYQASWSKYIDYSGPVHYPGNVVSEEEKVLLSDSEHKVARRFVKDVYDKDRFAAEFGEVLSVAKRHKIRVYCGEYGCLAVEANAGARYRWLKDMNEVFDSLGIARSVWCYREGPGGFGILSGTDTLPDKRMLECLLD